MNNAAHQSLKGISGMKLLAPIAVAATLVIVANSMTSSSSRRPQAQGDGLFGWNLFAKAEEAVVPRVERGGAVVGRVFDRGMHVLEKGVDAFDRNPDGQPDR